MQVVKAAIPVLPGIFHYVAIEEDAIRNDPVARTTELPQRVASGL
jgi:hypothetical protein